MINAVTFHVEFQVSDYATNQELVKYSILLKQFRLVQPRVFRFRSDEDGNIRVGIFSDFGGAASQFIRHEHKERGAKVL